MEKEEIRDLSDPKTPKKIGGGRELRRVANKTLKHKETSAAPFLAPHPLNSMQYFYPQSFHYTQHALAKPNSQIYYFPPLMPLPAPQQYYPNAYSNAVWDSALPVSVKGEDIPSVKIPDSRRQEVKGSSEAVGLCGDRSSRSEKEGTASNTNYTRDPSRSVACDYEASSDETDDDTNQESATKKPRLNQINDHEYSMVADSREDNLETAPDLEKSDSCREPLSKTTKTTDDIHEMRKQRRRELNRESAKRSRLRKQQEYEELQRKIEELKADSNELCVQLKNLSKECGRLEDENNQIKEELVEMYGPSAIYDHEASCSGLGDHENECNVETNLDS
ncbi:hypothetical protein CCACVL1_17146 [Corchorus capsularis]|uniref:BZIP domain-containing protein n=1 Tax=Corchorus capsularis TaxID=210143 RepID=A0A1R3HTR4_COCAP|nr:hypothetical protein CCACVL1_17146 [Corchorus capsularis]